MRRENRWAFAAVFLGLPAAWTAALALGRSDAAETLAEFGVVAAVALVLRRLARADQPPPSGASARTAIGGGIASVAIALVGLRWFVFRDGVPVLRHDWSWPVSRFELHRLLSYTASDWVPSGLGSPKAYPTLYTLYAPASWLAGTLSSHATLLAILLACAAVAGCGFVRLAGELGIGGTPAIATAAAYAAAPFVVDEFVAGHLPNVVAYDLLPAVLALGLALRRPRTDVVAVGLALGALVAVSAAQIQYVVFDALALGCAGLAGRIAPRRAALAAALAAGFVLVAHGQSIEHLAIDERHGVAPDLVNATHEWFRQLSSQTLPALAQSGYIGGYADALSALPPAARVATLAALAWFAIGYALYRGGIAGTLAAALALVGVIGSTGIYGPFADVKALLVRYRAFVALREFYNFQSLTTLGLAIGVARAFADARHVRLARYASATGLALVALAVYPYASGGMARELHLRGETTDEGAMRAIVRRDVGTDARLAMLPLVQPIREDGYAYGGADAYPNEFAGLPVVAQYAPDARLATIDAFLRSDDPERGVRLLGRLGARYLVLREDMVSGAPQYATLGLFAPDWSTRDAYPRIARSDALRLRYRGARLALYEILPFATPLSFAATVPTCAGETALDVLARSRPRTCAPQTRAARRPAAVELAADAERFDARFAWVPSRSLFSLGPVFAEHADAGIGTIGPNPYRLRFRARPGDDLAFSCAARYALFASLNGSPFHTYPCASGLGVAVRRHVVRRSLKDDNVLLFLNTGGPALLTRVETGRDLRAAGDAEDVLVPQPHAAGTTLRYTRRSPGLLTGVLASARPARLVFSDTFDDRWTLRLDGGDAVAARVANDDENRFDIPAGRHAFALRFETSSLDRALGLAQGLAWPVLLAVLAGTVLVRAKASRSAA